MCRSLDPHLLAPDAGVHGDGAAVGGVLDGVAHHVHQHLLQPVPVPGDHGQGVVVLAYQGVAPALALQLHRPAHRADGVVQGEAAHFHVRPPGVQTAEGQQVLDDAGHPVRLADDDVQKAVFRLPGDALHVPEGLGVAADVGEGGAQLVGDIGHELLAHLLVLPLGGDVVHHRHHAAVLPLGDRSQVQLQDALAHRQLPGGEVGPLEAHDLLKGQLLSEEGVVVVEGHLPAQHPAGGGVAGEDGPVPGEGNHAVGHVQEEGVQLVALAGHLLQGVLQHGGHIVEGGGEDADLIGGFHRDGGPEVPRRHPLRPLGEALDGDDHGLAEQEGEEHGNEQAHQQRLENDEEELAVEVVNGAAVVVDVDDVGVLPAGDGDGGVHIVGGDIALVAHCVRAIGDAVAGGEEVLSGLEALEALLVVASGEERAGAAIQDIVVAGAGVEPQVAGLGLDHPLDGLKAVGLGGLQAQGVDKGGVGGIGAAEDGVHLLVELVDEKAGDIGDHEGAHHRHQGGDQQQHDKDQLHMKAAKHSGSFPAARQGSRGEDFWGTRLGPGGHSMDFRDSAMSMRRSLGRIPREMTRVNSSVMTKEIR